jgi:hypothetical protein
VTLVPEVGHATRSRLAPRRHRDREWVDHRAASGCSGTTSTRDDGVHRGLPGDARHLGDRTPIRGRSRVRLPTDARAAAVARPLGRRGDLPSRDPADGRGRADLGLPALRRAASARRCDRPRRLRRVLDRLEPLARWRVRGDTFDAGVARSRGSAPHGDRPIGPRALEDGAFPGRVDEDRPPVLHGVVQRVDAEGGVAREQDRHASDRGRCEEGPSARRRRRRAEPALGG